MSVAGSMDTESFLERERYGSLERLIEREWEGADVRRYLGRSSSPAYSRHGQFVNVWNSSDHPQVKTSSYSPPSAVRPFLNSSNDMGRIVPNHELPSTIVPCFSRQSLNGDQPPSRPATTNAAGGNVPPTSQSSDLIDFRSCDNLTSNSPSRTKVSPDSCNNINFPVRPETDPCGNIDVDVNVRNRKNHCTTDVRHRDFSVQNTTDCQHDGHHHTCRKRSYDFSERCCASLPTSFDNNDRSVYGGNGYGSLHEDLSNTDQTLTYCVHGKPGAGCCATLLGAPTAPTINISVDEHCHVKDRDMGVNKKARRQIIVVSALCLFFMIAEAVGGYLSGSLAIATDAAHLLTDFAGFMISLFSLYVAARKPSRIMPFGWHRAEVIGAMVSVLTIWLVTGILVYLAVQRLISMDFDIDATVMLITSAIGVIVNIIMALTLHKHSHTHSHGGGGGASVLRDEHAVKEKENINVRAAFIHIIGDLLQSVGVFIAATVIYYKPEWSIVDPICTFMFSVLVLLTTFNIMKDALLVLMEGIPRDVDFNDVLSTLLTIDGVIRVHNLRIWALSLDKTALSAHLAIAPSADCTEILKAASKEIHKKYNFFEMTLQIEYFQQNMESCAQCQVPS